MNNFLKRFFYYWRVPLYFVALSILFLILALCFEGDVSTGFGVVWLFCCTFFVMSFFYALYVRVVSIINHLKDKTLEEEYEFPEIDFIVSTWYSIEDDIDTFIELSLKNKIRCIVFRLIGILLVIGGCYGAFMFSFSFFMIFLFTLVIIGGVTLWIVSSPNKYNSNVKGVRIVDCHEGLTEEKLFEYLKYEKTSLGVPAFARVLGFENPVMVYGNNYDDYIYVVYKSNSSDYFVISTLSKVLVNDQLPVQEGDDPYYSESTIQDFGYYLDELEEVVENAIERAETINWLN